MSWNSIYMTPRGYPAPPAFAKPANKANEDAQPATVKEAEDMQFAEALEQVRPPSYLLRRRTVLFVVLCEGLIIKEIAHKVQSLYVMAV